MLSSPPIAAGGNTPANNTTDPATATRKKTTGPLHNPRYKSTMCQHFANTGVCPYSEKCQFAHGPEELAKWQQNRAMQQMLQEQSQSFQRLQQQQQQQRYMYMDHYPQQQQQPQYEYAPQQQQQDTYMFTSPVRTNASFQQQQQGRYDDFAAMRISNTPQPRYSPRGEVQYMSSPSPLLANQKPMQPDFVPLNMDGGGGGMSTPLFARKPSFAEIRSEPRNLFGTQDYDVASSSMSSSNEDIASSFRRNHSLPHMNHFRTSASMNNIFEPPTSFALPSVYASAPLQQQQQPFGGLEPFSTNAMMARSRNRRGSAPPIVSSESAVSLADFTELDHLADELVSEQGKEMVLSPTPSSSSAARTSQLFSMSTVFPSSINDCL